MAGPTLAVWKFSSCDGCQLSLLDCEDELLAIVGRVVVAHFLEASSAVVDGPYDVSLVEGSVTTPEDIRRIRDIRAKSKLLVAIGACASAGGIQALRNFADVKEFMSAVYAKPEYISTLDTSTPISAHVSVDLEMRGCPIDKNQLVQTIGALLVGRKPTLPSNSVCFECKRRGTSCVMVAGGVPCLGPVTHAGCGALCPAFARGCFGCFGPADTTNIASLVPQLRASGMSGPDVMRVFHSFNAGAPEFALAGTRAADFDGSDGSGTADEEAAR